MSEQSDMFSIAFNLGIATATQLTQDYDGDTLRAIINASNNVALQRLSQITGTPEEDVALLIEPHIKPMQDVVDLTIKEMKGSEG